MNDLVQEQEPQDEFAGTANYKVILALKLETASTSVTGLQCHVTIQDKVKVTDLPQSEGQFFDLSDLPVGGDINMDIMHQNTKVGTMSVKIPEDILTNEETELSDVNRMTISVKGKKVQLKFKYYIIILNKKIFLEKNSKKIFRHNNEQDSQFFDRENSKNQSPSTVKFIKSQQEHEDGKYNQSVSKRLLDGRKPRNEVRTEPPEHSPTPPQRSLTPTVLQTPPSQRIQVDPKADFVSPVKGSNRQQSPFSKYAEPQRKDLMLKNYNKIVAENEHLRRQLQAATVARNDGLNQQLLGESLAESEQRRGQLQEILKSSVADNMKLKEEIQASLQEALDRRINAEQHSADLNKKNLQQQTIIEELELELTKKNGLIAELEQKNALIEDFAKLCKEQQSKLEIQDKKIKDLQDLNNSSVMHKGQTKSAKDGKQYQDQITKLRAEMLKEQSKSSQLQAQLDNANNKLTLANTKLASSSKLQEVNDRLKQQLKDLRDRLEELNYTNENLRKQIQKLEHRSVDGEEHELRSTIAQLRNSINDLKNQLDELNNELLKQRQANQELQLKLHMKANKDDQLAQNQNLIKENASLLETVNELTQQLRNTNKQLLEARLTAKDYEHEVEDKDTYINNMKRLILQMKERGQVYVPDNKDKIDKTLATQLNTKEDYESYRNMFLKESEGVYQFGSKKIYVKVEQDRVKIRSGGGFMSLEEFLQLFSQTEMEKLQRQDPLTSMSKNKAVQRKMDDMRLVNKMKEDQISPLRKHGK